MILSLTLDCQAPNSGIVRFFETAVREVTVSVGRVGGVISEAAGRARTFDESVDLSGISQGANDEIFQCGAPVLTGMDPESTYTYLLEAAGDRTAETWAAYMLERKERGLELETTINDGGAGLMAGIPQVFPNVEIQADTFHAVYGMGREVSKLERKAYKMMQNEYSIKENLKGKRPRVKNKKVLTEIQPKVADAVKFYDRMFILLIWLKELLSFSGYTLKETKALAEWVLQEMGAMSETVPSLQKEVAKVGRMLAPLLSFVGRLERGLEAAAKETGLPVEGFRLMYRQMSYQSGSLANNEIQCSLVRMLGYRYGEARDVFARLLDKTKKASSLVENLNGRIRVFIEVKRIIPSDFFVLLKVYFNTRRYKRSRRKERISKSPLELLTGHTQPEFLEALGY